MSTREADLEFHTHYTRSARPAAAYADTLASPARMRERRSCVKRLLRDRAALGASVRVQAGADALLVGLECEEHVFLGVELPCGCGAEQPPLKLER